jgi:hypothetical protein
MDEMTLYTSKDLKVSAATIILFFQYECDDPYRPYSCSSPSELLAGA